MTHDPHDARRPDDDAQDRWSALATSIRRWGAELGFDEVAICDASPRDLDDEAAARRTEARLQDWLAKGYQGTMEYMARHGSRRARPAELVPGTLTVVSVRMSYLPARDGTGVSDDPGVDDCGAGERGVDDRGDRSRTAIGDRTDRRGTHPAASGVAGHASRRAADDRVARDDERDEVGWIAASWAALADPLHANVSRYAHGRDYHKVLRARLQALADRIAAAIGPFGHRVFTDSAPVMEVELARRAGLGWRGKHTLLLSREGGSMFFLGELFTDVPLPPDPPVDDHCGTCTRCIDVCPTRAIVAPYVLDARRCISYLTIEHDGPIPDEFRAAIGNRIYGCDDCQLVCPWNRFAMRAALPDFDARPLATRTLVEVFAWTEAEFLHHTEGSAIRRIGHERWSRNVAVALGNALAGDLADDERVAVREALEARRPGASPLVAEHIAWGLSRVPSTAR